MPVFAKTLTFTDRGRAVTAHRVALNDQVMYVENAPNPALSGPERYAASLSKATARWCPMLAEINACGAVPVLFNVCGSYEDGETSDGMLVHRSDVMTESEDDEVPLQYTTLRDTTFRHSYLMTFMARSMEFARDAAVDYMVSATTGFDVEWIRVRSLHSLHQMDEDELFAVLGKILDLKPERDEVELTPLPSHAIAL